jgi:hypothetical protein
MRAAIARTGKKSFHLRLIVLSGEVIVDKAESDLTVISYPDGTLASVELSPRASGWAQPFHTS